MIAGIRKINFFELVLLIVGISVGVLGFMMINSQYQIDPTLSWPLLQTIFLWLLLIVILILAATMEDVKEELAIVIKEHIKETKVLKEISNSQLEELKLLRDDINSRRKGKPL